MSKTRNKTLNATLAPMQRAPRPSHVRQSSKGPVCSSMIMIMAWLSSVLMCALRRKKCVRVHASKRLASPAVRRGHFRLLYFEIKISMRSRLGYFFSFAPRARLPSFRESLTFRCQSVKPPLSDAIQPAPPHCFHLHPCLVSVGAHGQ
jgi:hypothetical protein